MQGEVWWLAKEPMGCGRLATEMTDHRTESNKEESKKTRGSAKGLEANVDKELFGVGSPVRAQVSRAVRAKDVHIQVPSALLPCDLGED